MKELYQNAEMDVVKFAAEDVIATSSPFAPPTLCDNELPPDEI